VVVAVGEPLLDLFALGLEAGEPSADLVGGEGGVGGQVQQVLLLPVDLRQLCGELFVEQAQARGCTPYPPARSAAGETQNETSTVLSIQAATAGWSALRMVSGSPWGQTVARVLSPEGLVIGISYAPSLH
jgi:hypothetical protein